MIDRRGVLAGATTLAGAVALAETASAQKSKTERSDGKRSFMVHMVVDVEMVGGDGPEGAFDVVRKHLEEELRKTIQGFSVRTVANTRLGELKVADIKK
jgi:hypothetical protein